MRLAEVQELANYACMPGDSGLCCGFIWWLSRAHFSLVDTFVCVYSAVSELP